MTESVQQETKICSGCGDERPITDFHRERKGCERRINFCKPCHNWKKRLSRARKHSKEIETFARKLSQERDHHRAAVLCKGMLAKFGGVPGFVQKWYDEYEAMPPGSPKRMATLKAVFRLIEVTKGKARRL